MFAINLDLLSLYVKCMPFEGPKLVNKICLCLCLKTLVTSSSDHSTKIQKCSENYLAATLRVDSEEIFCFLLPVESHHNHYKGNMIIGVT